MKYLLIFVLLIAGCKEKTVSVTDTGEMWGYTSIDVIEFDGCEYVHFGSGEGSWGAHKGNCKNKIHKNDSVRVTGLYD